MATLSEEQSPTELMWQLQADEEKCKHGFDRSAWRDDSVVEFITIFHSSFIEVLPCNGRLLWKCLTAARDAVMDEFAEVWGDSAKNGYCNFTLAVCWNAPIPER